MRGSRSKVRQYEGERTFLYKEESIPNSLNIFTVRLNLRMLCIDVFMRSLRFSKFIKVLYFLPFIHI